jgi:hypothetical protein
VAPAVIQCFVEARAKCLNNIYLLKVLKFLALSNVGKAEAAEGDFCKGRASQN